MRKFRTTLSLVGTAAVAMGASLLTPVVPASAAPAAPAVVMTPALSPVPKTDWCARPLSRLELYRSTSRFDAPNSLRLLDETKPIDLDTFSLGQSPFTDPSRVLWYRSLLWLAIAAVDAHERGDDATAADLTRPLLRAAEAFPDPARNTDDPYWVATANAFGWDEGTAFRRAEALLCLSSFTGIDGELGSRVAALLRMHGDALVDPDRYKGPPQRAVHNHGMLANLVLLDISQRLNEPLYRQVAVQRLVNDSTQVFSPKGWSYEGSTMYQSVNIAGWRDAADELRKRGQAGEAAAIDAQLPKARDVVAHLISPTGQLAAIGNTRLGDSVIKPEMSPTRALLMSDEIGGLATGRWSWSDPNTTWWTALNQPRKGSHGHDDNTAITWQTLGVPAVIDVGQFDYDDLNPLTQWMERGVAHNRAIPVATSENVDLVRTLTARRKGSLDTIVMDSTDKGPRQRREVLVDDARHSLQVTDSAFGQLTQYWHLAPVWTQASATGDRITYNGPDGRVLTITTSPGATIQTVAPSLTAPYAGLVATGFKQVAAAPEIRISGEKSISTTFQMYAPGVTAPELPPLTVVPTPADGRVGLQWSWPSSAATTDPNGKTVKPKKPTPKQKAQLRATKTVQGFRVQMRDPLFGWITLNADNGRAKKMRAARKNLINGTEYLFRVAPITATGLGQWSEPVAAIPLAAPGKPTDPAVGPGPGRAVSLDWTAPEDTGGAKIRRYVVTVGSQSATAKRAGTVLKDLPPGTTTVLVQAENKVGVGKPLRVTLNVKKNGTAKLA